MQNQLQALIVAVATALGVVAAEVETADPAEKMN